MKEATIRTARPRDVLTGIHPCLERVVDATVESRLILLGRHVTTDEIRLASTARLTAYLRRHGIKIRQQPSAEALAEAAASAARAQTVFLPGDQRTAALTGKLADELSAGRTRLKALKVEIEEFVAVHPDGAFIRRLLGMGAVLIDEFIASVGNMRRFTDAEVLAAATGLARMLTQS